MCKILGCDSSVLLLSFEKNWKYLIRSYLSFWYKNWDLIATKLKQVFPLIEWNSINNGLKYGIISGKIPMTKAFGKLIIWTYLLMVIILTYLFRIRYIDFDQYLTLSPTILVFLNLSICINWVSKLLNTVFPQISTHLPVYKYQTINPLE